MIFMRDNAQTASFVLSLTFVLKFQEDLKLFYDIWKRISLCIFARLKKVNFKWIITFCLGKILRQLKKSSKSIVGSRME